MNHLVASALFGLTVYRKGNVFGVCRDIQISAVGKISYIIQTVDNQIVYIEFKDIDVRNNGMVVKI